MRLKEYRKNTHQTHTEDLILLGKEGISELNDKIDKFIRRFDSDNKELNLTQKIDGAPALFCWSKYPGYPDNSIALKGFTSGPQNSMSSLEDIDNKTGGKELDELKELIGLSDEELMKNPIWKKYSKKYGTDVEAAIDDAAQNYDSRSGMRDFLKYGLELAKYIPTGECWQGDCLFSKGTKKEEEINGTRYITFMPNKIVYAFSEENADYNKVKNADFGIAFHTIYRDKDGNMRQGFDVDPTKINAPDNFYIMSPAINASKNKADYDLSALEKEYNNLKSLEQRLINDPAYEDLINNLTFMNYWNTFENANLADKKQVNLDINTFINDLKEYINDKLGKEYNKKLSTADTDKKKQNATNKYNKDVEKLADIINTNESTLINIVNALNSAANIKMLMWSGLKKAKNDYSTFYKSRTKGYIPSEGEGIAMSDMDGNIVKIVDRSTFSSYNRDPDIMSGFEHESLDLHEEFKLDDKLKKLLGDRSEEFIEFIKDLALKHETHGDIYPLGMYREDRDKGTREEVAHKFWLNKFNLDTAKRGVGWLISNALSSMDYEMSTTPEYKAGLDDDDTDKLPEDEKFKINLFYEWDAAQKNFFGDYDDDDPIRSMSFREFLQDKLDAGDYEDDHEKQLIKDAIKEVTGGSGYFKEMFGVATQAGDMGSFGKFTKKLMLDEDGAGKTAVVAFGRFNPPHIGHRKLAQAMANAAKGEKAKIYLGHTVNSVSDPLSYESKLRWAKKEWGDLVDVVKSDARTVFEALHELYEQGYTDIILAGGEDRIGGGGDYYNKVVAYNGELDKKGNLVYKFNSIAPLNAGERDPNSSDRETQASASLLRKLALENNFNEFKNYVYLNEKDAKAMFKELRHAMNGKEESFMEACDKRIKELEDMKVIRIEEAASEKLNTPLRNLLTPIISSKVKDLKLDTPNTSRDPKDALRITGSTSEEELVRSLKKALAPIPKDTIKTKNGEYIIKDIAFDKIGKYPGASGSYNAIPIELESTDGSNSDTLYITLKTSENKNFYDKQYTPNKVLGNGIGNYIKYNAAEFNEGYEFLENIYYQAVKTAKGDLSHYEATVKDMTGVNEMNVNAVMKDFGEVLSAGCLAKVLGAPQEMYFPAASNEPLIDFIVNGTIKVSQKAGSGAKPSGESMISIITTSGIDYSQILNGYSKKDINRIKTMVKFFKDYVYDQKDAHSGYVNLVKLLYSGNNFVNNVPNISSLSKYEKAGSVTRKNISKFIDEIKNYVGNRIDYDRDAIASNEYCDTLRIRYLARIMIKAINNDRVLIDGVNDLLSACIGEFIQVYLVKPNEFMKGHLIFDVKKIDSHDKYEFVDKSGIKNNKLSNSKLGIQLKH